EDYDVSNNLYKKTINKWDDTDLGFGRNFVMLDQTVTEDYDGNGTHRDKAESYLYEPTYGNFSSKTMWAKVTGNDNATFTDTGSDLGKEYFAYATNTTQYIVGLPYIDSLFDQSGNKVRENRFYYDGLALASVGTIGNQSSQDFWKFGTSYNTTQTSYNSY